MIRLMGILTGSAIAVGFLILTVGVPGFEATRDEIALQADPVLQSEASLQVAAATNPDTGPDIRASVAVLADEPPVMAPDIASDSAPEVPPEPMAMVEETPEPMAMAEETREPVEQQWYAFWSPFRSEIAADGFVSQLQRTTGLDYRVIKLKPGVFEVAFAYSDDNDIQGKLTQISTATGLDLTGG